jgi:hypothetical protein
LPDLDSRLSQLHNYALPRPSAAGKYPADGRRTRANFRTGRATLSRGLVTLPTNLPKRNEVFPSRANQAYCCWDWVCDRAWGLRAVS